MATSLQMHFESIHILSFLCSLLVSIELNSCQTQPPQNYFIDTFDDAIWGQIDLPYPNGHCTLTGNTESAEYRFYECHANTAYVCDNGQDSACQNNGACQPTLESRSYNTSMTQTRSLYFGECPQALFGENGYYAQIAFYTSGALVNPTTDNCQATPAPPPLNAAEYSMDGMALIATGLCVAQSSLNISIMMVCDENSAQLNAYSDDACAEFEHTLTQYSRVCAEYERTATITRYQTLTGCFVNQTNQLMPTAYPTIEPTRMPSSQPTIDPTVDPTTLPTQSPTSDPTMEPTLNPTTAPSAGPSFSPTQTPMAAPTDVVAPPVQTAPSLTSIDINNVTLLYVVAAVLLVFYVFICMYIWCNERRKRWILTDNFQKENDQDRKARMMYRKQHGMQVFDPHNADFIELRQYDDAKPRASELNEGAHGIIGMYDDAAHLEALISEGAQN